MTLPTIIAPNDPGHIADHQEIHTLLGRLDGQGVALAAGVGHLNLASRPAASASNLGWFWYAPDVPALYYSDGAAWRGLVGAATLNQFTAINEFSDDVFFGSGRPWVDVQHSAFSGGAAGDGVTNDLPAIHAARDALPTGRGGIIFFPEPDVYYRITGAVTIDCSTRYSVQLVGVGAASRIHQATNTANGVVFTGVHATVEQQLHGVKNLWVSSTGSGSGIGIYVQTGDRLLLHHVWVSGFNSSGIDVSYSTAHLTLFHVTCQDNGIGFRVRSNFDQTCIDSYHLICRENLDDGIRIESGENLRFIGTISESNSGYGIRLAPQIAADVIRGVRFSGLWMENNTNGGIHFNTAQASVIRPTFHDVRFGTQGTPFSQTGANAVSRMKLDECDWTGVALTLNSTFSDTIIIHSAFSSFNNNSAVRTIWIGQNGEVRAQTAVRIGDPGTSARAELDIATGHIAMGSTEVDVKTGAGSPEGVITAPVGSLYLRNNGGASTCLYVKESGAGNTGWVAK